MDDEFFKQRHKIFNRLLKLRSKRWLKDHTDNYSHTKIVIKSYNQKIKDIGKKINNEYITFLLCFKKKMGFKFPFGLDKQIRKLIMYNHIEEFGVYHEAKFRIGGVFDEILKRTEHIKTYLENMPKKPNGLWIIPRKVEKYHWMPTAKLIYSQLYLNSDGTYRWFSDNKKFGGSPKLFENLAIN